MNDNKDFHIDCVKMAREIKERIVAEMGDMSAVEYLNLHRKEIDDFISKYPNIKIYKKGL